MKFIKKFLITITILFLGYFPALADVFKNVNYHVCFAPYDNCEQKIIAEIRSAKHEILGQAFLFTNFKIAKALNKAALHGRFVEVLFDKQQFANRSKINKFFKNSRLKIKIDYLPTVAHNKVMIIDGETVITGSYNFTYKAQYENAENLLIIHDKNLAKKYKNNFLKRERLSRNVKK